MRYIWYLIAVVSAVAVIILCVTVKGDLPVKDAALIINKKVMGRDELNARFASVNATVHNGDKRDFISSLVTKELLIQEAQKEGIHKNEAFRRSIQDYYEESLVKQIMDKKIADLKVDVSDAETEQFATFQNSTLTVTLYSAKNEQAVSRGEKVFVETKTVRVSDLSADMADRLETIKPGESTPPLCSAHGCDVFRLDAVVQPPTTALSPEAHKKMRSLLHERKKQRLIDAWLAELKAKSTITIIEQNIEAYR